jgi:hypothetical protein
MLQLQILGSQYLKINIVEDNFGEYDEEAWIMYCENCGHEMDEIEKFCTNCGTPRNSFSSENIVSENNKEAQAKTMMTKEKKKSLLNTGIVILIVIIILVLINGIDSCVVKRNNAIYDAHDPKTTDNSSIENENNNTELVVDEDDYDTGYSEGYAIGTGESDVSRFGQLAQRYAAGGLNNRLAGLQDGYNSGILYKSINP